MTKVLIRQEDITILNAIASSNRTSKYVKQKLAEFRPIHNYTWDLHTLLSILDRASRQKIIKDRELNYTINNWI